MLVSGRVVGFIYTPENKRLEPQNTPRGKGETSRNHQFLGSMFVLGGVFQASGRF